MFRLLGKINIASQLTILVVFVAGLAIFVVSRASAISSRDMLLERALAGQADEALLLASALGEDVRSLALKVRRLANTYSPALKAGSETSREAALKQVLNGLQEGCEPDDINVIHEVALVQLKASGTVENRGAVRGDSGPERAAPLHVRRDKPTNDAVDEVWKSLARAAREAGHSGQGPTQLLVSGLHRASGGQGARPYLQAVAYPLPGDLAAGLQVLIVTADFTRMVERQARRLPRHLLFVRNVQGLWVYHPDLERVGSPDETWLPAGRPAPEDRARGERFGAEQRGINLGDRRLPDLKYYTIRKRLDPRLTETEAGCGDLESDLLALPGLRVSRVRQGAPSVVLSSPDIAVLDQARERIERLERREFGRPESWPRPILCDLFIGYYLERVGLDPDDQVQVGVILASAREEMTADVQDATTALWYRWFLPVLLASAGLALVAAYLITRPLRRLTEAAQRLGQGDYSVDVEVVAPGEVGDLARTFREMTAKIRQRERELRENLARMNTVLLNAADGIITFDQTGRIEQANAAAEEMFGCGPGGLVGSKVQKLMKLPQHLQSPVPLRKSASSGMSSSPPGLHGGTVTQLCNALKTPGEEHRGLKRDGTTFWMEVTFSQVPLEDRRLIIGSFRDVTQRKLADERIHQMNEELDARVRLRTAQLEDAKTKLEVALAQAESASAAKDRFISVVSHELRTPLTSAMGYTELLLNPRATRLRDNPTATLEKVLTSCKHLLTLINDLLDVGRYTAGKPIDLAPTRFDLSAFLRGAQEMVTPLVKKNGNVLESSTPADLGEIFNDETRLRQVLLNLLSNAAKFTEKGKVCLYAERRTGGEEGDQVVFRVSDTGGGMTPQELEKLFTPFYRVDNSTTRRQGGTGLGLTITKMLCELMGGTISVESISGQGSTFTVTLPAEVCGTGRKQVASAGARQSNGKPRRGTVLVIDDDATVRHMLETYLQQEGYRVVLAANGTEGLRLARENQPMCITLDVLMPSEDGWEVLAQLKNDPATRDIPVVMLTIIEERNRGFALGATDYVTKPIDWGRLGAILCRYSPGQAPILIVEDDALQRGYLREELILAGWTVLEAANGAEALRVCEQTTPSLILLDLTMPIMDGFTFLDELRRRPGGAAIPVVVVTARDLSDEDRRRLNRSVAQVLAKESLSKEQLLERIHEQMQAAAKAGH